MTTAPSHGGVAVAAGGRDSVTVRRAASEADWIGVRRLCCQTGAAGAPITPERWDFFAELWVGPYQRLEPAWTWVAEATGELVGYLTGCPDTRGFERRRARLVAPTLLVRLAIGRYGWTPDTRRFVSRLLGAGPSAEDRLRRALAPGLLHEHPAHLHLNVDARQRGRGLGRRLLEAFAAELSRRGVPGIHLYCGPGPLEFYRRLGFTELGALRLRTGGIVHALGRRLPALSP